MDENRGYEVGLQLMSKTIFFVRHGQTLFNIRHKIQGRCDSPLTQLGMEQAEFVRKYLKLKNIKFNQFFSSPQERACETIEIITNYQVSYTRLKELREKDYGFLEGEPEYVLPWKFSRVDTYPSMESNNHVIQRMRQAVKIILDSLKDNESALVVSHGNIIGRYIHNDVSSTAIDHLENGSIVVVEYKNITPHLKKYIHF